MKSPKAKLAEILKPVTFTALFAAAAGAQAIDAEKILAASDRARGGGLPGIEWMIVMQTVEPDFEEIRKMQVRALDNTSLATTVWPPRMSGSKLLQVGRNMWYAKPDLRKPISISSRQKLSGPAANGDIASTNYVLDYDPTLVGEETVNGEPAHVLDLVAKNKWVTYDRIRYWVSKQRKVALKAEFYTVSGKLFKTATFENDNEIVYQGERIPFVSKMIIRDEVKDGHYSVLEYSAVEAKALSPSQFHVSSLVN
ncbi:MAG TPA: outer membrane lipoprotein-sorting protein [Gammaproteobacteria bacterium]